MIDHDTARDLLPDFALDLLVHGEAGDVLDHLRACDVCLAEAQLYLHGARALSIALSRSPQSLSLRASLPRLPEGALARIRDRVLDIAPAEAEPTRRLVFARPEFRGAGAALRRLRRGGQPNELPTGAGAPAEAQYAVR